MDTLLQDLRYTWRTLVKSRVFTATALVVLALGIGANTTIYTIVRGIALRPLPFDEPRRLMFIGEVSPSGRREAIAPANFLDLARQSRAFERIAIHRGTRFVLTGRPIPESVVGAHVSSTFFATLRVQPQQGRDFLAQDESSGGARTAILSRRSWLRLFSEDPAIVGRTITLDGIDHTVVGILPAGFSLWETDVWVAGFDPTLMANRVAHSVGAIGRLKKGISLEQARAELNTIGRQLAMAYPSTNAGWTFRTVPLHEAWLGVYRPTSMVLLGAVAMVLLIACANLANLLLERALARDREMSVRLALGAGRSRLVRQMLTESLLLALAGGAVGVLVASWSISLVLPLIPRNTLTQIPGGIEAIHLDLHALGIALSLSLGTGILFGLAPAVRLKRLQAQGAPRESMRGSSAARMGYWWRRTLVVAQVALSTILLIGAALMVQSLWRLQGLDRGYAIDNALSVTLLLSQGKYSEAHASEAFFTSVIERLRALPGVTRVGAGALLSARGRPFVAEGQPPSSRDTAPTAIYRVATPEFLATMGIPLIVGRDFSQNDRAESPGVAIVNQTLARTVWSTDGAVGRRLQLLMPSGDMWVTVIGVASDIKESLDPRNPLELEPRPTIYRPVSQEPSTGMTVVVRTAPDPMTLAEPVRMEITAVDSTVPVTAMRSVRQGLSETMQTPRFQTVLLTAFAALALLLAAVGVYGVIAYSVNQRRQEIGIRMALGAAPTRILRDIIAEGFALGMIGAVLGVVGGFGAARLIAHYLYGIRPADPPTFIVVTAMLVSVAVVASYVPARRAAAVEPLTVLRSE